MFTGIIPDVPCEHELGLILHVHVHIPEGGHTIDLYIYILGNVSMNHGQCSMKLAVKVYPLWEQQASSWVKSTRPVQPTIRSHPERVEPHQMWIENPVKPLKSHDIS